jgi:hypothetical protein
VHVEVALQAILGTQASLFKVASPKHFVHFSGRFYWQVAQLSLHLKMHFVLSADKT